MRKDTSGGICYAIGHGNASCVRASAIGRASPMSRADFIRRQRHAERGGLKALADLRLEVGKAVLQLRPEQIQMWPAVETVMREHSAARHARMSKIAPLLVVRRR